MSASSAKTRPAAPPALSQDALLPRQLGARATTEIPLSLLLGAYAPTPLNVTDACAVRDGHEVPTAVVNG